MPTSDYHQISDVLHVVQQINPSRILDIGVGFGKWGILCREIIEIYNGRVQKETWNCTIDGIEIHEPYRNDLWSLAYNHVYIGDATKVIDGLERYDLVLCCDVMEHLDKSGGLEFIGKLLAHSSVVVITSPRGFSPQGPIYENEFEEHQSGWSRDDFRHFAHIYKDIGFTFLAVLSPSYKQLRGVSLIHPLQVLGVKKGTWQLLRLTGHRLRARFGLTSA